MNRWELRAGLAAAGWPPVKIGDRVVRGPSAWCRAIRECTSGELNKAIALLHMRGIDLAGIEPAAPCRWPVEMPAPRSLSFDESEARDGRYLIDDAEAARDLARVMGYQWAPLTWFKPVEPTAQQMAIVRRATAHARGLSLRLPADLEVIFVTPPHGLTTNYGEAAQSDDGRIRIWTRSDYPLPGLPRLLFHELRHAADFAAGRLTENHPEDEYEAAAELFAARALETWNRQV